MHLEVPVLRVVARRFDASVESPASASLPAFLLPGSSLVQSWLVGATDGKTWGWWGPISRHVAEYAVEVFCAIAQTEPTTPDQWGERARRHTRHAHSGLGSLAVGVFELAVWDLAGQRTDRPVWALLCETPAVSSVEGYATCFGFDAEKNLGRNLARELSTRGWKCQKWRPPDCRGDSVDELSRIVLGKGGIALDFGGLWPLEKVVSFLAQVKCSLEWIEEPVPPWRLPDLDTVSLPAPVAAGEHCYGPHETFLLEASGVSIWQPDSVFCGGFSNLVRIAHRAEIVGARCIPHGGGLLPAIHAAACGAKVESIEWHLLIEPKRQAHLADTLAPGESPSIPVPYRPGWGGRLHSSVL